MSWPDDGGPRFIVTSIDGGDIERQHDGGTDHYIVDRADAFHVCAVFNARRYPKTKRANRAQRAQHLADRWNAEDTC